MKKLHSLPNSPGPETEGLSLDLSYALNSLLFQPTPSDSRLWLAFAITPAAAPRFFQTPQTFEKVDNAAFRRTHPPTAERIEHLKTLLPETYNIYKANPECSRFDEIRAQGFLGATRFELA
ncbi:hypothetical protein MVEN_00939700 [Mycena venus]|uniref:Peptidase M48 domain-containing protein n=1 Tax=Mycena venus TaxID=2733690 RepID=A0A8H7D1M1_9AGAR|nr:hypothetical protein MVEN_00939700 [Mycena venus]